MALLSKPLPPSSATPLLTSCLTLLLIFSLAYPPSWLKYPYRQTLVDNQSRSYLRLVLERESFVNLTKIFYTFKLYPYVSKDKYSRQPSISRVRTIIINQLYCLHVFPVKTRQEDMAIRSYVVGRCDVTDIFRENLFI